MAKVRSRCVVIDASVAQAAGREEATSRTAGHCRDFLRAVLEVCHRRAFTDALEEEWNKHQSGFARRWRRSMYARRKVAWLAAEADVPLREQVANLAREASVAAIMLKDGHLIAAARASEMRVVSLDERVRLHYGHAAAFVHALRQVCWVNPDNPDDNALAWLAAGAATDNWRRLGYVPPED